MPEPGEPPAPPAQDAAAPRAEPAEGTGEAEVELLPASQLDEARIRLAEAEARERELAERFVRLQADFENFRRRTREEAAQASARGKESLLKALLPVLDNLDRAIAHTGDQGLTLLARQLHETLAQQNVQVVDPLGEVFDAGLHEAIARQEAEGAKSGTIVAVAEKGYLHDGRVLRPARVVVAS